MLLICFFPLEFCAPLKLGPCAAAWLVCTNAEELFIAQEPFQNPPNYAPAANQLLTEILIFSGKVCFYFISILPQRNSPPPPVGQGLLFIEDS